ncbi:MAG: T9SS type A sorting domain-containing protein [Bacteroidetes bacterium]|nr:MAG: T9SS type A sorting domain-containing protein [Bacteroidota bacterium]
MKKTMLLFGTLFLAGLLSAQTVKINEAYSRGVPGDLDWIEVYNTSSSAVDISGYRIYDNGGLAGTKSKKQFPAGTILPAKGFYAIVVDTATFVGDTSGFGISSSGETVWLENASGTVIDTLAIPSLSTDTSIARVPDGGKNLMRVAPRTKGKSNVLIKMNEVYTRGVAGALDWIEIHNAHTASIDISGYKIYDNGGQAGTKSKKLFPAGTIVPANGFTVIIVDTATFAGDTSGFGLSSGGETVWLENAAGLLIDTVAIPALGTDTSYARVPDGSNILVKKAPVTRGTSNGTGTSVRPDAPAVNGYALEQNYPNPFNPATTIRYRTAAAGPVNITVFDLLGKEVATLVNAPQAAGEHTVQFNAGRLSSGLYFYRLAAGNVTVTRKMVLMK